MTHPLENFGFRFRNFKGFSDDPGDWIRFSPITVLVGRNNTGKSAAVDALRVVLSSGGAFKPDYNRGGASAVIEIDHALSEGDLKAVFKEGVFSGGVPGNNHWTYGIKFVGDRLTRSFDSAWHPTVINGPDFSGIQPDVRANYLRQLVQAAALPKASIFQIAPERNVRPENENEATPVQPDGSGLTNLVRAFLYDARLPMSEVEEGLRSDLNKIYLGDTYFERLLARRDPDGRWEIFLIEGDGHPVRLSESGSSLRSVFTILAAIRLNPIVDKDSTVTNNVFCVEEPENNLHPSLLRRLLDFLSEARAASNSSLIITTHSATAIDWASRKEDCATFHVRRRKGGAYVQEAREYPALRTLLDDLDIRASELLQANGVIWVEGPSDRLYIRKWLELISGGALQEGVHFSTMFYGGKLLAHLSSLPPQDIADAISLLRLNRNLALVIDSDRRRLKGGSFRADLNSTKKRLIAETEGAGGLVWVTQGKEIENYISPRILKLLSRGAVGTVDDYESVPGAIQGQKLDKIGLAHNVADLCSAPDLHHLDLLERLRDLQATIKRWNSLTDS